MRLDVLEKISEIQELLEEMGLDKASELESMLKQFEEKIREEYYLEFLQRYKDLMNSLEDVSESIELLEGELVDDLNYLDETDIHAKKELLNSYLEELTH